MLWTSWTPDVGCLAISDRKRDANWNWKRASDDASPDPPGCPSAPHPCLTSHPLSHNLPAIIIPSAEHRDWWKLIILLKTKQEMLYIETQAYAYLISSDLSGLLRVLITVVAVLIPGPAQRCAHCLIRANLPETIPQLWSYPSYFHLPMTGSGWEYIYSKIIFYGVMQDNQEKRKAFRSAIFTVFITSNIYMTKQLFIDLETF